MGDVAPDAETLQFGVVGGGGRIFLDAIRLEVAPGARPTTPLGFKNLGLEEGQEGERPTAWLLSEPGGAGYRVALTGEQPREGRRCARLGDEGPPERASAGSLYQTIIATPYRGKRVRLRAAVRAAVRDDGEEAQTRPRSQAQLWLRVDSPERRGGFFDDMHDRPITSDTWQDYEIVGDVAADAGEISIGLLLVGRGRAWLDDVRFEVIGDAQARTP